MLMYVRPSVRSKFVQNSQSSSFQLKPSSNQSGISQQSVSTQSIKIRVNTVGALKYCVLLFRRTTISDSLKSLEACRSKGVERLSLIFTSYKGEATKINSTSTFPLSSLWYSSNLRRYVVYYEELNLREHNNAREDNLKLKSNFYN